MRADCPDGGRGLLLGDRARAPREGQARHPGGDGPRGHEHHFAPLAHAGDLRGQRVDAVGVDSRLRPGDEARADLDDQAPDPAQGAPRIALGVGSGSATLPRARLGLARGPHPSRRLQARGDAADQLGESLSGGRGDGEQRAGRPRRSAARSAATAGAAAPPSPPRRSILLATITCGPRREVRRVLGQLGVDDAKIVEGIAARLGVEVEHVDEEPRPLGVAQETGVRAPCRARPRG